MTSKNEKVFVPAPECMVASGECLALGRCLAKCKERTFYQHQRDVRDLLEQVSELRGRIIDLESREC